ncbi:MAG: ABC transporter substrate-binding protein [Sporichthyaceae bacterium]
MTVSSSRYRPRHLRRSTLAAVVAAAVLASTACGSDGEAPQAAPTVPAVTIEGVSSIPGVPPLERNVFPTRIKHTWNQGGTVIERLPERIVVLGMREQDTMTALGGAPLTVRNFFGAQHPWTSFPWLSAGQKAGKYEAINFASREERTSRVSKIEDGLIAPDGFAQASNTPARRQAYDFDDIAARKPDLIVAMFAGVTLEDYQALSKIAPTITMVSSDSKDYASSWQEEALVLGKIVGRPQAAIDAVASVAEMFADVQFNNPALRGASVALAAPGPNGAVRVINPYAPMARFFTSLGLEYPNRIESLTRFTGINRKIYHQDINVGGIGILDGVDVLVWIVGHDGGEAMEKIKKTSPYQNLRVVRSGNVLELGPDVAESLYYSSITSLPWAVDQILPKLLGKLGDKAARDKAAAEAAERAAEQAGDLAIDYDPNETVAPNPYQELLEGEAAQEQAEREAKEAAERAEKEASAQPTPAPAVTPTPTP